MESSTEKGFKLAPMEREEKVYGGMVKEFSGQKLVPDRPRLNYFNLN